MNAWLNHDDLEFCVLTEDESEAVKRILVAAEIDIDKVKNDEFIRSYTSGYGAGKEVGKRSSL